MIPVEKSALTPGAGAPFSIPGGPRAKGLLIALVCVLGVVIFLFDLALPLGVAGGVPYVSLVLLGRWFPSRPWIFLIATVSSILTIAGFALSPDGGVFWMVLTNRFLALFAIWATALLLSIMIGAEDALRESKETLRSLYETAEERTRILEIVGKIARAAGSSLEPDELFEAIAGEIRLAIPCDHIVIGSHDMEKIVHQFYEEGNVPFGPPSPENFRRGLMAQEITKTKQPLNIPDLLNSAWKDTRHAKHGYRSIIAIPILQDDQYVAHMLLARKTMAPFSIAQEELLVSVASHLAPAIRNATLHREANERATRLEITGAISRAVGSTLKPDDLFITIVQEIRRIVPCDRCVIGTVDRETFRIDHWYLESEIAKAQFPDGEIGNLWWFHKVYEENQSVNTIDFGEHDSVRAREFVKAGFRSGLIVPILQDNRCIGHLSLARSQTGGFTPDEQKLLTSISNHLGPAIRNTDLYREAAKRASHLAISGEIAKAVSSTLKPEDVFRTIVKEIRRVVPCERCLIVQPEPESESFRYLHVESDIDLPLRGVGHRSKRWVEKLYSQGKPYRVADYTEIDTPNARILAESGLRSGIFVPILQGDKSIAHFGLLRKEMDSFTAEEEELLLSIATHLGSAIRNATLYEESRNYTAQLRLLGELSRELSVQTDPASIFEMIGHAGREAMGADRCVISEISEETGHGTVWSFGLSDRFIDAVNTRKKPRAADIAVRGRQPVFIPDARSDERTAPMHDMIREEGYRSVLHLPFQGKRGGFGTLSYHFDKTANLSDHFIETAQTFANHAGASIEKAHLFEESQRRADRLEVLNQVTQKITGNLSLDDVLASISDATAKLLRADHARIYLLDAPSRDFVLQASSGISPPASRVRIQAGKGLGGAAIHKGEPVMIGDVQKLNFLDYPEWIMENNLHSYMAYPLKKSEKIIGLISCISKKENHFTEEDSKLLGTLASQAIVAIGNASLYEESENKSKRLATLVNISQRLTRGLDLTNVLRSISEAAAILLDGEAGFRLLQGNQLVRRGATPGAFARMGRERIAIGEPIAGLVAQSGEPFISEDSSGDTRIDRKIRESEEFGGAGATLCVPLLAGPRALGTLSIFRERGYVFGQEEVRLATSLATQAAVAIENASLHMEAKRSRDFFRSVVDDNADAIYVTDNERRVIMWNGGAEKLYGYAESEAIGQSVGDLVIPHEHQEDWFASREHEIESIFKKGKSSYGETDHRKRDGSLVPVEVTRSPVRNENGEVIAICAVTKDLTDRIRAEKSLRESEERYRTLAKVSPAGIFRTDGEGNCLYVNESWCEMSGLSMEEALGTGWQKALHPDDRKIVFDEWTRARGEDSPFQAEYRFLRADGVETWVTGQAEAEIGEDGEIKGYVGTVTDITKIKEAGEKILHAKEEAESASRAKSEFLSTVSHELRSPLNAVIGFSDLLLRDEGVKDELTLHLVPKIQESGKQLLAMIEELLDHDRIEQGKVKLDMESFSINNLIAGAVDSWQSRLPGGFSMSCDLDSTCGPVNCDSTRITQILSNLIDNAFKYSPEGGAIHITTLATPEEVRVSIRDEGMGMSPEEMLKIFDRFQQLESGSTHRAGGLGIGLSLVRKLMEMHGGRIWVESEKGEGSTFTFALPQIAAAETQSPVQGGGAEAEDALPPGDPWTGRSILVVDDLDHYHEYMKLMMRSAGQLLFASDGREAIETARRENPDLILMDLRMPVMNGFEAIERLKFDPATKDIPIVAVTAQAMEEDQARSALAGANGFVTKPIDMEFFRAELGRVLGVRV